MTAEFLQIFKERGFFYQCSDWEALEEEFKKGPVTAYIGFDATADCLHVGSLVQLMILRWLQKTGNKPIVLLGGATTRVGDPSDKNELRKMLSDEQIEHNIAGIKSVAEKFISFGSGETDSKIVNNYDWLGGVGYLDFLREIGRYVSINRMLSFDFVKRRLENEQNLTFLEFNYMLLQAYDFVELAQKENCKLQFGGSEQWGNIINGIELGRKKHDLSLYGLTAPLITTSSGKKMGKTADGAVWLSENRLSVYDYYQFWRNTDDADVGRFLKLFTELEISEIEKLEALEGAEINEAKKILAFEATKMCHGEEKTRQAEQTAKDVFEKGTLGADLPTITVSRAQLESGVPIIDLFKDAGLATSNGDVKRLVKGGGAKLNDQAINDAFATADLNDLDQDGAIKLSAGKKRHAIVKITE